VWHFQWKLSYQLCCHTHIGQDISETHTFEVRCEVSIYAINDFDTHISDQTHLIQGGVES